MKITLFDFYLIIKITFIFALNLETSFIEIPSKTRNERKAYKIKLNLIVPLDI